MFYTGADDDLSAMEYRKALAERLGCLATNVHLPVRCPCEELIESEEEFLRHCLCCPRGQFTAHTGASYTSRHDAVKEAALVAIPRKYGIPCTVEPETYASYYSDNDPHRRRPDVEYHTSKHIAIDLSIVYPYEGKKPGTRAAEQAQAKWTAHHRAVEAAEHIFIPFVIETTGYLDPEAFKLIKALASQIHMWQKRAFTNEITRAISVALTRQKVRAITAASERYRR